MKVYCRSAHAEIRRANGELKKIDEYDYYAFVKIADKSYCVYKYQTVETKHPDTIMKPIHIRGFVEKDDLREAKKICGRNPYEYLNGYKKYTVERVPESEATFLHIPKEVSGYETLSKKTVIDPILSDEMVENIRKVKNNFKPFIIMGEDWSRLVKTEVASTNRTYLRIYCSECGNIFFPETDMREVKCPVCGKRLIYYAGNVIADENVLKRQEDNFVKGSSGGCAVDSSGISAHIFYVKTKPNGVIIYDVLHRLHVKGGVVKEEFTAKTVLKHLVGEETSSYKLLKSGNKEIDPFEALNINSRNLQYNCREMYFEGYDSFFDFMKENYEMLKKIGFMDVSKYGFNVGSSESFFMLFIGIMNKYPVLEQIVKMGYVDMFFGVCNSIYKSGSKDEISVKVAQLSQLVNTDATRGKEALRIPTYIGEYLRRGHADIKKYFLWRDVYEVTNLSKERFLEVIESPEYSIIIPHLDANRFVNILKFDYPILKLFRYILKGTKTGYEIIRRIEMLSDYLNMCDILQVAIDKYPVDLKEVHDKVAVAFKSRKDDKNNKILAKIAEEASEYVLPKDKQPGKGVPKLFDEYTVVFPDSEGSLLDEGNQQHNCVGSYTKTILDGYSVVFFIRKKESPEKSFITAECTDTGLHQIYYSNNRRVENKELVDFGRYVCRKIISGCKSQKITALQNSRYKIA